MKALQLVKPRQFQVVDIDRPEIVDDQILVRLEKAVLCGSDIPKFAGTWPGLHYPLPAGMPIHECIGTVVESQSPRFEAGDLVVAVPRGDVGLAELYPAEAHRAAHVPGLLAQCDACLLIQPLSTVVYALDRLGDINGRTAMVVGLGAIGLLTTWLLSKLGAIEITGVDPIGWRCDAARRLGAAQTLEIHSDRLVSLVDGDPSWKAPDICVEAVGQQMRTINNCLHLVKHGGLVLALGVPLEPIYPFEYTRFFRKNLHLVASVTPPDETTMVRAADLVARHEEELAFLITHRFGLDGLEEAYTLYETRAGERPLKIAIDGTGWPATGGREQE
ncbi:MAG: zinc-binding dehydrogenase [Anaerolineae bacterium]|nr:zinc-binding dehydrogenase [Anaerolineae bacterium]